MAEDKLEPREFNFRQWFPWTQLFRGFWLALCHKKLLLAAAGILTMSLGWFFLANIFFRPMPLWSASEFPPDKKEGEADNEAELRAWHAFKQNRNSWNLLNEAAGTVYTETDAADLADSPKDMLEIQKHLSLGEKKFRIGERDFESKPKRFGKLRTLPWFEDRGQNPFLLVTGQAGGFDESGSTRHVPWQRGQFIDWVLSDEAPVLLEPLFKFLRPVVYFLHPNATFRDRFYFLLAIAWMVLTWAIFGGAITRIAAVEIARNEKISIGESVRYVLQRWRSYVFASFAPLIFLAAIVFLLMIFGLGNLIPVVREFWNGILWFLVLGAGLVMAVLLIGLVGWPLIHATLSAEGSDSFDAISRCYSYVLQKPWSYIWYSLVSLVYGTIVVFFVGLMGSLMVYLGKWGVDLASRDTSYMFIWAPTSFGWRDLLLQGTPVVSGNNVVTQPAIDLYTGSAEFRSVNYIGPFLVSCWLYLVFLMIVGFGYSFFWSMSTMTYLLMRRKVDDTDMDEVYLEEDDSDDTYTPSTPPAPSTSASSGGGAQVQMVDAPTLRTSAPESQAPPAAGEMKPPEGNSPPAGPAN